MVRVKRKSAKKQSSRSPADFLPELVPEAAPGCHIALLLDPRGGRAAPPPPSWPLGRAERFDPEDFGLDAGGEAARVPDLSLDPHEHVLTAINASATPRVYHVTAANARHRTPIATPR